MISTRMVYLLFIGASFAVGWLIPGFYDWTGSDQSRPSPLIGQFALGWLVGAVAIWGALPWLKFRNDAFHADPPHRFCFQIRELLIATVVAACIAWAYTKSSAAAGGITVLSVIGWTLWAAIRSSATRWPTSALMACMYFPFFWILDRQTQPEVFLATLGLPSFLPGVFCSRWIGQHFEKSIGLAMLLTAGELAIGNWMIQLGEKKTIAYLVFILLMSTFGSFILNALVRM